MLKAASTFQVAPARYNPLAAFTSNTAKSDASRAGICRIRGAPAAASAIERYTHCLSLSFETVAVTPSPKGNTLDAGVCSKSGAGSDSALMSVYIKMSVARTRARSGPGRRPSRERS